MAGTWLLLVLALAWAVVDVLGRRREWSGLVRGWRPGALATGEWTPFIHALDRFLGDGATIAVLVILSMASVLSAAWTVQVPARLRLAIAPAVAAALVVAFLREGALMTSIPLVVLGLALVTTGLGHRGRAVTLGIAVLWAAPAVALAAGVLLLGLGFGRRVLAGSALGLMGLVLLPAGLTGDWAMIGTWFRDDLLLRWPEGPGEPWIGMARLIPHIDRLSSVRLGVAALVLVLGSALLRWVDARLSSRDVWRDARAAVLPVLATAVVLSAVPSLLPLAAALLVPVVGLWAVDLDSRLWPSPSLLLAGASAGVLVAVVDGGATTATGDRSLAWTVAASIVVALGGAVHWFRGSPVARQPATAPTAPPGLDGVTPQAEEPLGPGFESTPVDDDEVLSDKDLKKAAVKGAAWLGIANVVAKGAQAAVTLALAAFLSPEQLGYYSVTNSVLQFVGLLQTMGLFDVITRTRRDADEMASVMTTVSVTIGSTFAVLGFTFADQVAALVGVPPIAPLLRLAMIGLPFSAYSGVQIALITRRLQFERRVLSDGGSAILGSAVTIALAAMEWGAKGAVIGATVSILVMPVLAFAAGTRPRFGWDLGAAREAFSWALVAGPGSLISVLLLNMDYVVTGRMLGEGPTGVYGLGYRMAFMPFVTVAVVLAGVAFPILAEVHRANDPRRLGEALKNLLATSAAMTAGVYAVLFTVADHVDLLGDKWVPATGVLRILCLYGFFLSINLIPLDALRATGHKGKFLGLQIMHFLVLLATLVGFTHIAGIMGTASAQAISAGLVFVVAATILVRAEGLSAWPLVKVMKAPLLAAAMTVGYAYVFALLWPHDGASLPQAMVQGLSGVLLYFAALALLDRPLAAAAVSRLRRR